MSTGSGLSRKTHLLSAGIDGLLDALGIPLVLAVEQQRGQVERFLDADAPGTERSLISEEELLAGRIVQEDPSARSER